MRFTPEDLEKIKLAADALGESEQTVIRIATRMGLVQLRKLNYQIAEHLEAAADDNPSKLSPPGQQKTA